MSEQLANAMKVWLVQPWHDEGEGYVHEPGVGQPVRAESKEEARKQYQRIFKPRLHGDDYLEVEEISEAEGVELLRKRESARFSGRQLTDAERVFLRGGR